MLALSTRQNQLLAAIVEEYTKTCGPVGSQHLAGQVTFRVSPATIRNDMAELEQAGMLSHPYTSAGRIPTVQGLEYYVENLSGDYKISARERAKLTVPKTGADRQDVKTVAKNLAELSCSCVVVGFSAYDVYYTGIANLFSQPEFSDQRFRFTMSEVIDHLDEVMLGVFEETAQLDEPKILLGEKNPFGAHCGVVIAGFGKTKSISGVMGVLGPVRMNYPKNRMLVEYVRNVLTL